MEGIVLINKDKNKTSRDVVNELTHIFGTKKIGHTGTLDPIATGVLVVCIGKYTKLVNTLVSLEKEYIATIKLGIKTDTLDITGNVLEKRKCIVEKDKLLDELKSLIGEFKQTVPIYSAKKVNGKKLYEYARNNESVVLPENIVTIYDIELLEYKDDEIKIRCDVSKGTYIRSLIQKICDDLDIIGTMSDLVRTKQGCYNIKQSYTVNEIKNGNFVVLNARDILNYKSYNLTDEEYQRVKNGNHIKIMLDEENLILLYNNKEVAIYKRKNDIYIPSIMLI